MDKTIEAALDRCRNEFGNRNELDGEDMKIKVDVITLHAVQNYGSVLQALATQKLLERHGCEVRIINYIRENVKYENLLETRSNGIS